MAHQNDVGADRRLRPFERWVQIALVLRAEGFFQDEIERLGCDKLP